MIKKEKTALLIDIAIPDDSKFNTRVAETLSNYKDLETVVSMVWKVRTKIVPVIIGASGTIKKGAVQNLQLLRGHPWAIELQKVTLMSIAHSIRTVLGEIALISRWDLDLPEDRH
jgi:hypothetical protein